MPVSWRNHLIAKSDRDQLEALFWRSALGSGRLAHFTLDFTVCVTPAVVEVAKFIQLMIDGDHTMHITCTACDNLFLPIRSK